MSTTMDIPENIMEQARAWFVRLADEQAGAKDWESFTLWLEESPSHVDAYDHVELMVSDIPSTAPRVQTHSNVVSFSPKQRPAKFRMLFASIAALLIIALTVFVNNNSFQANPTILQYATNVGGYKDIVLSDGTKISLNTNTQISVAMDKKTRTVTLKQGEAFFDIALDKKRPFLVHAQDSIITDIGTAFSVYASKQALTVSVVSGIVDVAHAEKIVRLTHGQQAVRNQSQDAIAVASIDVENVSTWRDGFLIFEDAKLSSIVPELNRYLTAPIQLSDNRVADLRFSGILNITDQETLLKSMKALMPIQSETKNGQIRLSRDN